MFVKIMFASVLVGLCGTPKLAAFVPWPKEQGVYAVPNAAGVPAFPSKIAGFTAVPGYDYFGDKAASSGNVMVEAGSDWELIDEFPYAPIDCISGVYTLRWQLSDPTIKLDSAYENSRGGQKPMTKNGSFGFMYGSSCTWPQFRFPDPVGKYDGRSVEVKYEVKYWKSN